MRWPKRGANLHYLFESGRHQCVPQQQGALAGAHWNGRSGELNSIVRGVSRPQTTDTRNVRQASPRTLKEGLRVTCLKPPEGVVQPATLDQLTMGAALGNFPMMEHENHVGIGDGAETVGNRDGRSSRH